MDDSRTNPVESEKKKKRRRRKQIVQQKAGTSPGTLLADPEAPRPIITILGYNKDELSEERIENVSRVREYLAKWPITWVNVDGVGDATVVEQLGEIFHLHRLALEDVLHTHQRAKVEHFEDVTFFVARLVKFNPALAIEQLSVFFGRGFVLTFQEDQVDSLTSVRERIRLPRGKLRSSPSDYLAYCVLDAVVDSYFPVLEEIGERLDNVEDGILAQNPGESTSSIHSIKRDLLAIRRAVWPQRDALNIMIRDDLYLFSVDTKVYLRDCYDHIVRTIDLVEMYRELGADLMDLHLSVNSNRMNEIVKVLTVISTIFIPLTFITGLYGMNFNTEVSPYNMPELNWHYGYPFALFLVLLDIVGLLAFFKYKRWL